MPKQDIEHMEAVATSLRDAARDAAYNAASSPAKTAADVPVLVERVAALTQTVESSMAIVKADLHRIMVKIERTEALAKDAQQSGEATELKMSHGFDKANLHLESLARRVDALESNGFSGSQAQTQRSVPVAWSVGAVGGGIGIYEVIRWIQQYLLSRQ